MISAQLWENRHKHLKKWISSREQKMKIKTLQINTAKLYVLLTVLQYLVLQM